jgi:hypothetical protein
VTPYCSGWFANARALVERVEISRLCSARLQFEVSEFRSLLVIADGRIARWEPGSLNDADVELRWRSEDARGILFGELLGDAALLATTVVAPVADGMYVGLPAPVNLLCRPELASLPVAPGATFGVQFVYRRGPFGDVHHVLRFADGRLVEDRLGTLDQPDATIDMTYAAMARERAGEISMIESLEGGTVTGEIGPLAALAGIIESPEFHAAEVATGRHALALAVLGELTADSMFASAMKQLTRETQWT